MTVPNDDLERIVSGAETIEKSLSVLTAKQSMSREAYRADRETRDVVERRFVKLTEATLDIARTLVVHERGSPPESNIEDRRLRRHNTISRKSTSPTPDSSAAAISSSPLARPAGPRRGAFSQRPRSAGDVWAESCTGGLRIERRRWTTQLSPTVFEMKSKMRVIQSSRELQSE
jgi:hypothetical protein